MDKIIVGLGEILWDVFPDQKILGGAPANFAYHASQFGFNGYAISAVGNDTLGKEILDLLEEKELNHLIETTNFPTGTVQVTLDGDGVPQYEICEDVAWDNIPFSDETERIAKNTVAVCFGSLAQRNTVSRSTIQKFIQSVPDSCLKIFDINLRQNFYTEKIIKDSLKIANILKVNEDEIVILADMFKLESNDETIVGNYLLKEFNLEIVILTKGTEGSFVLTKDELLFQPTPIVKVADTVGAGDSFTAAFVSSLLSNKSIKESHKIAVEVSAYVCQKHGGMPEFDSAIKNIIR